MVNACGRSLVATVLVAASVAGVLTSCRKKASNDADADVDAALVAARSDAQVASTAPSAAPAETVTAPALTDGPQLRPSPGGVASSSPFAVTDTFGGSYRCVKGVIQLVQSGIVVRSTTHTNATTDTIIACTLAGDVCTGSVREIQTVRGKPPKVNHVKGITLTRTSGGDILFKPADPKEHPVLCRKQ